MTRLLRIETCSDCPFCDYDRYADDWGCQHPGAVSVPYTLSHDDDGIDVTEEVDDACPLEEAT